MTPEKIIQNKPSIREMTMDKCNKCLAEYDGNEWGEYGVLVDRYKAIKTQVFDRPKEDYPDHTIIGYYTEYRHPNESIGSQFCYGVLCDINGKTIEFKAGQPINGFFIHDDRFYKARYG